MTSFKEKIYKIVGKIPHGNVVSYGQVALMAGIPRASRQVGWVLRQLKDDNLPWWRVINNKGYISIKNTTHSAIEQKALLEKEGIKVEDNFTLDINKYRYKPSEEEINKLEIDQESLEKLFKIM